MRAAALLALCLCPGCIYVSWSRTHINEPVSETALARIEPGATLEYCLKQLGAPTNVWRSRRGNGQFGIAYGWLDDTTFGLSVSIPFTELFSPSLRLSKGNTDLKGVVLWFNRDLKLYYVQRGRLTELASGF